MRETIKDLKEKLYLKNILIFCLLFLIGGLIIYSEMQYHLGVQVGQHEQLKICYDIISANVVGV